MVSGKHLLLLLLVLLGVLAGPCAAESDDELAPTNVILFLFFGLGCGIVVTQLLSYYGEVLPYTVIMFLLGLFFSIADTNQGTFGQSVRDWVSIDADLMLFVFLPPLVFGEAMNLNWYYAKGGMTQSFMLAGPGVVIGAAIMGVLTKLLVSNWAWNYSMMFASILGATDTVAMVSLLKTVGASPKLTILIVGESLLNDGSAMTLFTIFYNSVNGTLYTADSITEFIFYTVLGSIVLGLIMGMLTVRWLRSANRPLEEADVTMQIGMTFCSAYITFYLAQNTFEISGILACASCGAVCAWLSPPIILNHTSMHNVWGMIEWALNTTIFLLAGLICGHRVISKVEARDWGIMLLLYVCLNATRFITIFSLYPVLSSIGHRCTIREGVFMSWAGLRGALGLALALLVENNCPDDLHEEKSKLFFYVAGVSALTLIVNGTTAKWVLVWLGLVKTDSPERALVTQQIRRKIQKKTEKIVTEITKDFELTEEDMHEVRMSCTLLSDLDTIGLMRDTDFTMLSDAFHSNSLVSHPQVSSPPESFVHDVAPSHAHNSAENSPNARSHSLHFSQSYNNRLSVNKSSMRVRNLSRLLSNRASSGVMIDDVVFYVRGVFLEIVRVRYWQFIEEGRLPRLSFSAQFLLYTIEKGLDEVEQEGGVRDWRCIQQELSSTPVLATLLRQYIACMPSCLTINASKTLGWMESRNEKREVYMLSAFIDAHTHAQQKIHRFLGFGVDLASHDADVEEGREGEATGESRGHRSASMNDLPCPEEVLVVQESKKAVEEAKRRLAMISPDTIAAIRAKQAARVVLAKQAELIQNMAHEGLLSTEHAEEYLNFISKDTQRIEQERNYLYKEQQQKRARQVQFAKVERESETQRPSFLSLFRRNTDRGDGSGLLDDDYSARSGASGPHTILVGFARNNAEEDEKNLEQELGQPLIRKSD